MANATRWLRISYWVGAVLDGVVGLTMAAEAALGVPSPLTHYVPEPPYRYAIALAASLMLGWTLLLLWADRQPVQRRGVLLITNVAIVGLACSNILALSSGLLALPVFASVLALQVALVMLFTFSYSASVKGSR